jgi:hypothetical protein
VLAVFIVAFLMIVVPWLAGVSPAASDKTADYGQSLSRRNLARWENLSESQKMHFRKLYRQYRSLPVEKQVLLKGKLEAFSRLPKKVQRLVLNNSKRLMALSEDDRRSFYRLIKKYQKLPPSKKFQVHRAFRKVRTLPKAKQLELFHLLIEENRKPRPAIRKVIKDFLIQAGLVDPSGKRP